MASIISIITQIIVVITTSSSPLQHCLSSEEHHCLQCSPAYQLINGECQKKINESSSAGEGEQIYPILGE